jgi:ankyrin repeat protein/radical SAM superfamily enzyme YgiQ (UPF0313 family)
MRILLVGPEDEENLSIRYLSSSLLAAGHEVDLTPFSSNADMDSVVSAASEVDLIGLSMCFQARAREFLELARRVKNESPDLVVVAGGHYASCSAGDLLHHHPEIDLIVIHEGERTLVEIAEAGSHLHNHLSQIKGIAYRKENDVAYTAPRPIIDELDGIPPPDRRGPVHLLAGVPTAHILGSRGCLGACDYCCISTLHRMAPGKRFRQRSTESIADEMVSLYNGRGIRQFIFEDDNFLVPSKQKNLHRLDALESALDERGVHDIAFAIKCRPAEVDFDVFQKLKEMGLLRVFLGIESGNSTGLSSIGRKQTVDDSEKALAICEKLGISAQYIIMLFNPDTTIATIRADIDFMQEHINFPLNFSRTEIYSGTPLERQMIKEGRAKGNYLVQRYHLQDPAADLACTLAKRSLLVRCSDAGSLMNDAIRLDHLSEVMKYFYQGTDINTLYKDIHLWRLKVNKNSMDLLERLINICSSDPSLLHAVTRSAIQDLIKEEAFSRNLLFSEGEGLRHSLDELTLRMVGLRQVGKQTKKIHVWQGALATHAAAVMLALCITGAVPSIGVSHPSGKETEEEIDTETDGLYEQYELKIFGTDYKKVDTDDDGVPDSDEDHDGDGITNLEEQKLMVELMDAVEIGNSEKVNVLIDAGVSADAIDRNGTAALIRAALHGHIETVQTLLDSGANVNAEDDTGTTPLMHAAENGHNEVIRVLLNAGANVNARSDNGLVALMIAAGTGNVEAIKTLINAAADVNATDNNGFTALLYATSSDNFDTMKILLDTGADVDATDNDGYTALMRTAKFGNEESVKTLLDAGADVHAKDNNNTTALMFAESNGHDGIADMLKKSGAKE